MTVCSVGALISPQLEDIYSYKGFWEAVEEMHMEQAMVLLVFFF